MSSLLNAAKAVIEKWDLIKPDQVPAYIKELHAAVERAEKQEAMSELAIAAKLSTALYKEGYEDGQQAERERIRSRVQIAAEKTWKAGDWYVGPQHNMIEKFVEELLRDDDN